MFGGNYIISAEPSRYRALSVVRGRQQYTVVHDQVAGSPVELFTPTVPTIQSLQFTLTDSHRDSAATRQAKRVLLVAKGAALPPARAAIPRQTSHQRQEKCASEKGQSSYQQNESRSNTHRRGPSVPNSTHRQGPVCPPDRPARPMTQQGKRDKYKTSDRPRLPRRGAASSSLRNQTTTSTTPCPSSQE